MDSAGTSSDIAADPKGEVAELLSEVRGLTKMMRTKVVQPRPRFPHACRNGSSCLFLACKSCWFVHEGDEVSSLRASRKGYDARVSATVPSIDEVPKAGGLLQASLDKFMIKAEAKVEKRINDGVELRSDRARQPCR